MVTILGLVPMGTPAVVDVRSTGAVPAAITFGKANAAAIARAFVQAGSLSRPVNDAALPVCYSRFAVGLGIAAQLFWPCYLYP